MLRRRVRPRDGSLRSEGPAVWSGRRCMNDFALPVTRYALSGDVSIAYQVMGDGPIDLVMVPGVVSHVEFMHELPGYTAFLRRLSNFARVITFDKRGQGLSDRVSGAPSLEERMDDVRAVMDAADFEACRPDGIFRRLRDERLVCRNLPGTGIQSAALWWICAVDDGRRL